MLPLGLRECILRKNCCSLNFVQIKMNVWTTGHIHLRWSFFSRQEQIEEGRGEDYKVKIPEEEEEREEEKEATGLILENGVWVLIIILSCPSLIRFWMLIVMMLKRIRMGGISILTESCSPWFLHFHFHCIRLLPRPQSQKSNFSQNHLIGSPAFVF